MESLAERLFPGVTETPEQIIARYPKRNLPEGAAVTRFAPSPTGFMHLGNLYGAIVDERLAHRSGGVFMLRIEDTDLKRSVNKGVEKIISTLGRFGLCFDEGVTRDGERGNYGPYRQRQREKIYKVFAKALFEAGRAYPCFATEEELKEMRERQKAVKDNPGYYGKYAIWRDADEERILKALDEGRPYVIRFRSQGDPSRKIIHNDLIRGRMEIPENNNDFVLLKSDGIPTYHFAHVVDDTLMGTTHVVRDESWLPTLPWHLEMFAAMKELFGWKPPKYIHTAQLLKLDNGKKRKLSKRKDPELALDYYGAEGYPEQSLVEYLMTVLNSNYEEWRAANPDADQRDFPFSIKKMSAAGALFDMDKLIDVSKNLIARMGADEVYSSLYAWANAYDPEFFALLDADPDYARAILGIGRGGKKPRKDLAVWKDAKPYMAFFYDELFAPEYVYPENMPGEDILAVLKVYAGIYDTSDDSAAWFDKIKTLSARLGYAPETKLYKAAPEAYKGHVGDVSMVLRVAVTGRQNSPDLYEVMRLLGKDKILKRLEKAADQLER